MGERGREPTVLGEVLRAALARSPLAELQHFELWTAWERVVGPAIARHAQPTRMRRGVLVVAVDGPEWMHELHWLKQDLRDRLNAHLGRRIVRDVYLVLTR